MRTRHAPDLAIAGTATPRKADAVLTRGQAHQLAAYATRESPARTSQRPHAGSQ